MRKQFLAILLTLLLTNQLAVAGTPDATTNAGNDGARVNLQRVRVDGTADGLQVELTASQPVVPKVSTLAGPPRLVLDFPHTALATSQRRIAVDRDGIKAVRLGDTAVATRVVIDMTETREYQVSADGNRLLVTFKSKSADSPATSELSAPISTTMPSAPTASPFATKAALPVKQASVPAKKTPKAAPAVAPAVAQDTVAFMEPLGAPEVSSKAAETPAQPAPVRALDAAAKFSEKPLDGFTATAPSASLKADDSQTSGMAKADAKPDAAVNLAAEQKTQRMQQPAAAGAKYTGEPISVNLKDVDVKDFFRLIHEISGLNVVLDPAVKGNLTLVLDDVPWDQALDIVLKNNDLDRKLEGNVLRIATIDTLEKEAKARQAQQEAETMAVEKVTVTRFLSYARSKDVVLTAKKLLSVRGEVVADDRTNALIIQDVPSVIPNIDRLLAQLDRKTQEVEIEARVVAATRSFARDIGTQFGFGWGNSTTALGGGSGIAGSGINAFPSAPQYITIGGASGKPGSQIPLFSNLGALSPSSGLSFINVTNNIRLDAVLTMAESRGLLKILSRPRVVTQNNIQAVVKQGVKIPITTLGQLGGPPTVTYVDAFLRLTVTPQITSEGTIFLNVDVENTTPDFSRVNADTGNPTLITQQATTQILVTDGGTVVIGGVIQTQNSLNIQQVPLLGNVPYLGNLFKRRSVTTATQELIFFITPHIIQT